MNGKLAVPYSTSAGTDSRARSLERHGRVRAEDGCVVIGEGGPQRRHGGPEVLLTDAVDLLGGVPT
jgi:hypothetical protein